MFDTDRLDDELNRVPLFSGLSRRQRRKLLEKCKVVDHHQGAEVATEGGRAMAMHLILEGTAEVSVRGKEVGKMGPGEYFGEISMIDGKPRSATVTASEPLCTLAVPHLAFMKLLDDDPSAAKELLIALCARLREKAPPAEAPSL